MLILMLNCQKTSALELNPKPNLSCLSHEEKIEIANTYSDLEICHVMVERQTRSDHDYWTAIEISILGGIIAGALLNQQLHK